MAAAWWGSMPMFVTGVQVRVDMHHIPGFFSRPNPVGDGNPQYGQSSQARCGSGDAQRGAHVTGDQVGQQPAGVGQGKVRGKHGGAIFRMGRATQQAPRWCLCQRVT